MNDRLSFSYQVKSEICKEFPNHKCCALAECYGILLFCNTFSVSQIRIVTEHPVFSARLPRLFRKAFALEFDEVPELEPENGKYTYRITDPLKIHTIYSAFDLDSRSDVILHLNRGVLENECCDYAFVRGAFLAGGSAIDPEKRYHLELATTHSKVCLETYSLLLDLEFSPKEVIRNGTFVLYFKQSNQIEDLLTAVGAPLCAMKVMEAKIEKQMRNQVNRVCNCDEANTEKVVTAAQNQLGAFQTMPQKMQEIAVLREQNPEAALSELAVQLGLSKSAVNHRMRKIMELARD